MSTFIWPSEDGWPYPDTVGEMIDHDTDLDDDLVTLRTDQARLLRCLEPLEREVLTGRFGLDGRPAKSVFDLGRETGLSTTDIELVMGSGLTKLRRRLA